MKRISALILISLLFFSCQTKTEEKENSSEKETEQESEKETRFSSFTEFPKVDSLVNFPNTEFIITLDQIIPKDKNVIYAPTIAYCWDEIKKIYDYKITIDKQFTLLNTLNKFDKHKDVLDKDEYEISVERDEEKLRIKAYFKKSLPFALPMTRIEKMEKFGKDSVCFFGFKGYEYEITEFSTILYYDKNEFILRINSLNDENEIFLYSPSVIENKSLLDVFDAMIEKSMKFIDDEKIAPWKKYFNAEDEVKIPVIAFNLETRFPELESSSFWVEKLRHDIVEAYQRNAFMLNENGAIVESEGELYETTSEEPEEEEEELPQPKFFFYNKPFYIFIRKNEGNSKYPYFVALIQNSELMIKNNLTNEVSK